MNIEYKAGLKNCPILINVMQHKSNEQLIYSTSIDWFVNIFISLSQYVN